MKEIHFKGELIFVIFIIVLLSSCIAKAQDGVASSDSSESENNTFYKAAAITGVYYATSMCVLSKTWYKDRKAVPFHFFNDNKGYLQVDKFGHAFGSYVYSYIGYHGLLNLGFSRDEALAYAGSLGFVLQFPIEIMDGIHEGWGFSWGDIAANSAGSILVIGQELLFREQILKYKFSYWESKYSRTSNGMYGHTTLERMTHDYNGHTYWLSMPLNIIIPQDIAPDWLNIAVGYGADGMYGENENLSSYGGKTLPSAKRYRQYLLSLDIDWTKIETDSGILKAIFTALTFLKAPFPAIEINSTGQCKGYWLYF